MTRSIAANGTHTTNGTPHASTTLTPHIVVSNAERAIEFYRSVFDARVVDVTAWARSSRTRCSRLRRGSSR